MGDDNWVKAILENLWVTLLGVLVAMVFGILRYGQEFTKDPPAKFRWSVGLIKAGTAGAVGFLSTLLCLKWKVDPYVSGVLIAIAGWGGVETLNIAWEIAVDGVKRKLGNQEIGK